MANAENAPGSRLERGPSPTAVAGFPRLDLPPAFDRCYGHVVLHEPLVVPDLEMLAFGRDVVAIFRLLESVPARCFDGDFVRFSEALGMAPEIADVMLEGGSGPPELYARADAYHDGEGFQLLELNVGSELGGVDAAQLNRAFVASGFVSGRDPLGFVDTSAVLAGELRAAAPRAGRKLLVALVEANAALAEHLDVFAAIKEALEDHDLDVRLCEIGDLDLNDGGAVCLHGAPIDVVLRYFAADQIVDDEPARAIHRALVAAHRAGRTALFTSLHGGFYASKAALGLLHDPVCRARMGDQELELVDRVVPWTRNLGVVPVDERPALAHRCAAEQDSLVLKPGVGYGGVNTTVGAEVTTAEWRRLIEDGIGRDYVVQRFVRPRIERIVDPVTGVAEPWRANWGVFVTSAGYAGSFVRALRVGDGEVISFSNSGTRAACVFTAHPSAPDPVHPDRSGVSDHV